MAIARLRLCEKSPPRDFKSCNIMSMNYEHETRPLSKYLAPIPPTPNLHVSPAPQNIEYFFFFTASALFITIDTFLVSFI